MKDQFTKDWIINNSLSIVERYEEGILTLRALHYQLVSIGMTNDLQHYKRVVNAMIDARWNDQISFNTFSDLDRSMVGETLWIPTVLTEQIDTGKKQIHAWINHYKKNRWENQLYYPEVFIEKKALQGVFQGICEEWDIALGACKGYPSLTFLHDAYERFDEASYQDKIPVIIYFGDYDPSGEDIPRSIGDNLFRFGVEVDVKRIALKEEQVLEWNLPPAPAKVTDTRSSKWDGIGQVELDAVKPEKLIQLLVDAISDVFDENLYSDLLLQEETERLSYQEELKQYVKNME